jgi:hypothetical protein
MRTIGRTFFALVVAMAVAHAAGLEPRWRALKGAARAAVQAKDHAKLGTTLLELRPRLPGESASRVRSCGVTSHAGKS